MAKGARWPREDRVATDERTGRRARQVMGHPAIHHHPFFFVPAYDRAWAGPFPYKDGPGAVEAAQHTYPHPRFAPDGSRVVSTSDRSGYAQIYDTSGRLE